MNRIFYLVLAVIAIFVSYRLIVAQTPPPPARMADLILFWGDGCPHCQNVDKYIKQNERDLKISIDRREIYYNRTNQKEMARLAQNCPEIDTKQGIGVPFAWVVAENKCLQGDTPIISLIGQKLLK